MPPKPLNTLDKPPTAVPLADYNLDTPPEEFDHRFVFPLPDEPLETQDGKGRPGVRLECFVPSLHAKEFHDKLTADPRGNAIFDYMPFGPFPTLQHFLTWFESRPHNDPGSAFFVVYDISNRQPYTNQKPPMAGLVGLLDASRVHHYAELGYLMILPEFHRTHVATHACCTLMKYCMGPPPFSTPANSFPKGLQLRRIHWKCHANNQPSSKVAKRLGMKKEAVLRWHFDMKVGIPEGYGYLEKPGNRYRTILEAPETDSNGQKVKVVKEGLGRDTEIWALGWDEWDEGGWKVVEKLLEREILG